MSRAVARKNEQALTDRQRMTAVLEALAANGVAYWFDLRGSRGSTESRWEDYTQAAGRAGTDRWVGEHIGSDETGGGFWGDDGRLYGGNRHGKHVPYEVMWWSFNHEIPELADLLVALFTEHGFDASWGGALGDSVHVRLDGPR